MTGLPHTIYLVRVLSNIFHQEIARVLRPVGLTLTQVSALSQLASAPGNGLTASELRHTAGVTAQSMSAALVDLEYRGLVVRTPNPVQARFIQVRITKSGRDPLLRAQQLLESVDTRAMALLTEDERAQLRALLLRTMSSVGLSVPDPWR